MVSVQQMLDMASRHLTAMADAMVAACLAWSVETGVPLDIPHPHNEWGRPAHVRPVEDTQWDRMVEGNSDTRWCHT